MTHIWGHGYAWLVDEAGIKRFREKRSPPIDLGPNLFVNNGESELAKALVGQSTNYPSYMAVGTGITAAAETDTALQTEVSPRRLTQRNVAGAVFSGEAEWEMAAFGSTQTLKEFGLFSASSGGILYDRIVYSTGISKTTSQIMVVKIDIGFN